MTKEATKWYAFVPNLLTIFNLVLGTSAIWFALNQQLTTAALLMLLAAAFDFFDGFAARLLKVSSEIGKQLDSLADMVSFGVLPGAIAFSILTTLLTDSGISSTISLFIIIAPLIIPAFSALRLARFNIDTRQTDGFIGLPTPANALFWASLGATFESNSFFAGQPLTWITVTLVLIVAFSLLLVAELPMFALKFKTFKVSQNKLKYFFLLISAITVTFLQLKGIAICVVFYLLLSISVNIIKK